MKSGSNTLRMAVIGAGAMGRAHCRTISGQVETMALTAVVDIHIEAAREAAAPYGAAAFESIEAMLKANVADAAIVATPHPLHAPAVEACLGAGLHVISEKPLAETVSAADRMLAAAEKASRTLAIMFQLRFDPVIEAALAFIRDGGLGHIRRTLLLLPDFRTQAYYEANPWRATWTGEGGGVLVNQAPHLMDIFTLIAGLPETVDGTTSTRLHRIEVEDQAEARLRYANGATGYLYASTNEPAWHERIEVVGTRGSLVYRRGHLECSAFDEDVETLIAASDEIWRRPEVRDVTPVIEAVPPAVLQKRLMENFADHILNGRPLRCDAESGRRSLELANAITLSSHLGKPVDLPVPRDAYDALLATLRAESRLRKRTSSSASRETDPRLT